MHDATTVPGSSAEQCTTGPAGLQGETSRGIIVNDENAQTFARDLDGDHSHAPTQKIIYMSWYSHEVLAQHGAATSSFTLLQKPFTKLDLLRTVATLDRRS